jgi:electron transport complex protein RnfD
MSEEKRLLNVSASPHFRSGDTVTGIMFDVIIAMIPSLLASTYIFGLRVLLVTAVSVISCVGFEFLSRKVMKRHNTLADLSAVVTGMLLAFNLPVDIPIAMVVIGAAVAIIVAKQFFGGIGQNFVNPALVGRIVLMVSFPVQMSKYGMPFAWKEGVDVITTATPLQKLAAGNTEELPKLTDMLLGLRQGSIGEVCAAALLLGFLYLLIRRVIKPTIPLCFVGTVAVIMLIAGKGDLTFTAYEVLSGGLLLGAIFMATDYTTSPVNFKGQVIFAVGCGLITSVIRLFGSLPEGVSFSIIIMNILVPQIEKFTTPKPFGTVKEKKAKKEKEAAK